MHEAKPGDVLYLHEDGSVHKVRVLDDLSDKDYFVYRVEVLEAIKPQMVSGYVHTVGHVFDVAVYKKALEFSCWEFLPTRYLES